MDELLRTGGSGYREESLSRDRGRGTPSPGRQEGKEGPDLGARKEQLRARGNPGKCGVREAMGRKRGRRGSDGPCQNSDQWRKRHPPWRFSETLRMAAMVGMAQIGRLTECGRETTREVFKSKDRWLLRSLL